MKYFGWIIFVVALIACIAISKKGDTEVRIKRHNINLKLKKKLDELNRVASLQKNEMEKFAIKKKEFRKKQEILKKEIGVYKRKIATAKSKLDKLEMQLESKRDKELSVSHSNVEQDAKLKDYEKKTQRLKKEIRFLKKKMSSVKEPEEGGGR